MRHDTIRLALSSVLAAGIAAGVTATLLAAPPLPPLKPGLWESKTTVLDANGKETVPPEMEALAKMPPEMRAKMAEMMKANGAAMPDASGAMKVCMTKQLLESGQMQAVAEANGCTTTYSTQTASNWKWHSTCPQLKTESDGEAVFTSSDRWKTTLKSTVNMSGRTVVQTRIVESKWLSADCGDVKPLDLSALTGGRPPARPGR